MQIPMNNIFKWSALLSALMLIGCGTTARTMSHNEATKARAAAPAPANNVVQASKGIHQASVAVAVPVYEHPTYNMPVDQAWPLVRAALSTFCDGKLVKVDEQNHHLEAKNQNVWSGDTYVMVNIRPDQQRTVVEVAVRDYGWNRNLVATRSPHILGLFLERLDRAMKQAKPSAQDIATRLQLLDDLKAKGLITDEEYRTKRSAILGDL